METLHILGIHSIIITITITIITITEEEEDSLCE